MKEFTAKLKAVDGKELKFPSGRGVITHVCCDCGLTHLIEVIPSQWASGGFTLKFYKDNRSTGQRRRHLRKKKLEANREKLRRGAEAYSKTGRAYPVID